MIRRSVLNTLIIVAIVFVLRHVLFFYFLIDISIEAIVASSGVGVWVIAGYLFKTNKNLEFLSHLHRRILESKAATIPLVVLIGILLMPLLIFSRAIVVWESSDTLEILVDDQKEMKLKGNPEYEKRDIIYGFIFDAYSIRYNAFKSTGRMMPFIGAESRVPLEYTAYQKKLLKVEDNLLRSLLIYHANRYLTKAEEQMEIIDKNVLGSDEKAAGIKKKTDRLRTIASVLKLSLLKTEYEGKASRLADEYKKQYENDSWGDILVAIDLYAQHKYGAAAEAVGTAPWFSERTSDHIVSFFKAACLYRGKNPKESIRMLSEVAQSIHDETVKDGRMRTHLEEHILSGLLNYKGMVYNDLGEYESAVTEFKNAAEVVTIDELICRGLANAGYVLLEMGKFGEAERILARSKKHGQYSDTNYAYAALAQGKLKLSRSLFEGLVKNDRLRKDDPVALQQARVMLAFIDDLYPNRRSKVIENIEAILDDIGSSTYGTTKDMEKRLAHGYYQVAVKLYLNKPRGLNLIVVEFLARAATLLKEYISKKKTDASAEEMLAEINRELSRQENTIPHGWKMAIGQSRAFHATKKYFEQKL